MKLPLASLAPARRRRALMSLATLAAAATDGAETGRILCVVPSRWPPSRSLEAVASTWLKDCDDVAIAVSARQYNASRGATVARRKSARKFITRSVAVTHDGTGFTPWLPIRSAVSYAAARRGFDWLAMVEDDSVLHLKRLRAFLGRFSENEPLTFGQCVTRTVNGTGHTGPSEFCATSI